MKLINRHKGSNVPLAVLTGASGGLGSALLRLLIERGWHVLGIDQNEGRMAALTEEFSNREFIPMVCDIQLPNLTKDLAGMLVGY